MTAPRQLGTLLGDQTAELLEAIQDALIVTDPSGKIVYLNSAAHRLYGFERLHADGVEDVDLRHYVSQTFEVRGPNGETVPEHEQPLSLALSGQRFSDVELSVRHRDTGEERVLAFSSAGLGGKPRLSALTMRDVTEHRKAERRYKISFDTNPAPTVVARLVDGCIVDLNEGFTVLTGLAPEEIGGMVLRDLGLLSEQDALDEVIGRVREGEEVQQRPTKIDRGFGEVRDVLVAARSIEIDGEDCGIFTFIDVTELLAAEKRLRENSSKLKSLNEDLDALTFGVAHELRTPLRGIDGFSQLLLEDYGNDLDETGRGYLERVRLATARLGTSIDALLMLTDLVRSPFERGEVDLSELVRGVALWLQEAEREGQLDLEVEPGMVVRGDRRALRVLIHNLLHNAWRFGEAERPRRIEVGREARDGDDVFFVRDNGKGFDPAYADTIFEPFKRLVGPAEGGGLGIGLAVAQRVVEKHGGEIWAEGKPGEGAAFYFTLEPSSSG